MTARRPDRAAADELLFEAIGRRLAGIDEQLPRLQPWRPDRVAAGQLHVVRGRVRRGGVPDVRATRPAARHRVEVGGAAIATVLAVAILVAGRGIDGGRPAIAGLPSSSDPSATAASTSSTAAASAAPTATASRPAPKPTPNRPSLAPRQTPNGTGSPSPTAVDATTLQAVLGRIGSRCGVLVAVAIDPLGSGVIDKLSVAAADTNGYFGAPVGPGWIGIDPAGAARAFKARPLLVDAAGSVWALRGDGPAATVLQVVPEQARSGAIAWRSADVLWPVVCPPPGTDGKRLIVGLRPGEWPVGQVVDLTVVRTTPGGTIGREPR